MNHGKAKEGELPIGSGVTLSCTDESRDVLIVGYCEPEGQDGRRYGEAMDGNGDTVFLDASKLWDMNAQSYAKAVKADNAEVPVDLWNDRIATGFKRQLPSEWKDRVDQLRVWFVRIWKRRLRKEFVKWLAKEEGEEWNDVLDLESKTRLVQFDQKSGTY